MTRRRRRKSKKIRTPKEPMRSHYRVFCEQHMVPLQKNPAHDMWHCPELRCNYTLQGKTVRAKQEAGMKLNRILTERRRVEQKEQKAQERLAREAKKHI